MGPEWYLTGQLSETIWARDGKSTSNSKRFRLTPYHLWAVSSSSPAPSFANKKKKNNKKKNSAAASNNKANKPKEGGGSNAPDAQVEVLSDQPPAPAPPLPPQQAEAEGTEDTSTDETTLPAIEETPAFLVCE